MFKATTKDKALVSAFITTDGEGKTVRTAESLAANYIDKIINARDSKIKDPNRLTPEHEKALKDMLKHMSEGKNTKYKFARDVNNEINRQQKALKENKTTP